MDEKKKRLGRMTDNDQLVLKLTLTKRAAPGCRSVAFMQGAPLALALALVPPAPSISVTPAAGRGVSSDAPGALRRQAEIKDALCARLKQQSGTREVVLNLNVPISKRRMTAFSTPAGTDSERSTAPVTVVLR